MFSNNLNGSVPPYGHDAVRSMFINRFPDNPAILFPVQKNKNGFILYAPEIGRNIIGELRFVVTTRNRIDYKQDFQLIGFLPVYGLIGRRFWLHGNSK